MIEKKSLYEKLATHLIYDILLNTYFLEFWKGALLEQIPLRNPVFASALQSSGTQRWIRLKSETSPNEFYCPLAYYSPTGRHRYSHPILNFDPVSNSTVPVSLEEFTAIVLRETKTLSATTDTSQLFHARLESCVQNLAGILEYRYRETRKHFDVLNAAFIETEQALILGHAMHPLAKDRSGFSREELRMYSPEYQHPFRLHYFLCSPELFVEETRDHTSSTDELRRALLEDSEIPEAVRNLLFRRTEWELVALHPWEAQYQLSTPEVQSLLQNGRLLSIGRLGPLFHATSSVRTVWSPKLRFMLKFSLHAKLTNSIRVNHPWELPIGIHVTNLLQSKWGAMVAQEFPEIQFIFDPGYYTIRSGNGESYLDGFSTIIRNNPFESSGAGENIALIASLCEDSMDGNPPRLKAIVHAIAQTSQVSIPEVAYRWFARYLNVFLEPLIRIYSRHGLALEAHQQNILLALDSLGFPGKTYFRDNQGYFIREEKRELVEQLVPGFGRGCFIVHSEEHINPKFTYYLVINNLIGVISAMGRAELATEEALLAMAQDTLEKLRLEDESGLVSYILDAAYWTVKGNLSMSLINMNEATQPIENPAIYLPYSNPFLSRNHYARKVLSPERDTILQSRYIPEYSATMALRLFDAAQDLDSYHDWFHQEYAKPFWDMADSLEELELFYLEQESSPYSKAYTGLLDGTPVFAAECYWAPRDIVGRYYDVQPGDYGLHLLIAPPSAPKRNFSLHVLFLCLDHLFSDPRVTRVICEADHRNTAMDQLLKRAGFRLHEVLHLPTKTANLTYCTRESVEERKAALFSVPPVKAEQLLSTCA